jgi:ATP-dependent RNA helicase SUPV3L1/SUV3
MSVVGCSGEDFASILQALGFRRERRKLPAPAEIASETPGMPAFDEIWRPGRRKDARRQDARQAKGKLQPRTRRPEGQPRHAAKSRPEKRGKPRADSSPFAVLAELRRNLAARRPDGG